MSKIYYGKHLAITGIEFLRLDTKKIYQSDAIRYMILYCLKDMGNDLWLPLNRDYKPIGFIAEKWVDYKDFDYMFIPGKELNFSLLWDNNPDFFFFADSTFPRDKHLVKRYETIIYNSLFNSGAIHRSEKEAFSEMWGYKYNIGYKKQYEYNINRFKNEQ